jgi:hypothetical protein
MFERICRRCREFLTGDVSQRGKLPSPPGLPDDFIRAGSKIHSRASLKPIRTDFIFTGCERWPEWACGRTS